MNTDLTTLWDVPAVPVYDAEALPEVEDLYEWAVLRVSMVSAKAFADHVWTEWDEYEPDGSLTIGEFVTDLLDQWRGLDNL